MTDTIPPCPECASEHGYELGALLVCPMCGHEWSPADADEEAAAAERAAVVRDAVGNELRDGDDVTVVKSRKVKGGGEVKIGTKVRGIRPLDEPVNGHDIDAKVPGHGQMYLKTSVVKKA